MQFFFSSLVFSKFTILNHLIAKDTLATNNNEFTRWEKNKTKMYAICSVGTCAFFQQSNLICKMWKWNTHNTKIILLSSIDSLWRNESREVDASLTDAWEFRNTFVVMKFESFFSFWLFFNVSFFRFHFTTCEKVSAVKKARNLLHVEEKWNIISVFILSHAKFLERFQVRHSVRFTSMCGRHLDGVNAPVRGYISTRRMTTRPFSPWLFYCVLLCTWWVCVSVRPKNRKIIWFYCDHPPIKMRNFYQFLCKMRNSMEFDIYFCEFFHKLRDFC